MNSHFYGDEGGLEKYYDDMMLFFSQTLADPRITGI